MGIPYAHWGHAICAIVADKFSNSIKNMILRGVGDNISKII